MVHLSYLAFMSLSLSLIAFTLIWDTNPRFIVSSIVGVAIINTELRSLSTLTWLTPFTITTKWTKYRQWLNPMPAYVFSNLEFFFTKPRTPAIFCLCGMTKDIVQNTTRGIRYPSSVCVPSWSENRFKKRREENHWEQIAPKPLSVRNSNAETRW